MLLCPLKLSLILWSWTGYLVPASPQGPRVWNQPQLFRFWQNLKAKFLNISPCTDTCGSNEVLVLKFAPGFKGFRDPNFFSKTTFLFYWHVSTVQSEAGSVAKSDAASSFSASSLEMSRTSTAPLAVSASAPISHTSSLISIPGTSSLGGAATGKYYLYLSH